MPKTTEHKDLKLDDFNYCNEMFATKTTMVIEKQLIIFSSVS